MDTKNRESVAASDAGSVFKGPDADPEMLQFGSPKIRHKVWLAHFTNWTRARAQRSLGLPVGNMLLMRWLQGKPGAQYIERAGLPRHNLEAFLGERPLTLHIDPRTLIRNVDFMPQKRQKRPSSLAFIWDGSWDLRRDDLRVGTRYRFITDIDKNRHQLERAEHFQTLMACIERGQPWSSPRQGILLDAPEKIKAYLDVYVGYLDDMASRGYVASRTRDDVGVAISREGRILKINRGLHRLAMAQYVGLGQLPVRVRAVHRIWWDEVTQGASGLAALERMCVALRECVAEQLPGPLDVEADVALPHDFWPPARMAYSRCSSRA
ncbi:hypothetical protein LKR43_05625 [Pusillimonas sp. MFBS29]|uniref:hypothetical protein n=1 Tax=Pusillimonas sp. MFBS29 TaxID=2886690 RepID=UPI001D0FF24E|nr:hypothetical protein [Pusillimonas sp. MFBS29]MCC2595815.1 hypothetical protein [Pusillimonas sp. MFBS29]